MAELNCTVESCTHNEEHYCCKGDIFVEGKTAEESCNTCCASFREKTEGAGRNSLEHPSHQIEVDCEVENCVHNDNCRCAADHIGIAGGQACKCQETQCSSFKRR